MGFGAFARNLRGWFVSRRDDGGDDGSSDTDSWDWDERPLLGRDISDTE